MAVALENSFIRAEVAVTGRDSRHAPNRLVREPAALVCFIAASALSGTDPRSPISITVSPISECVQSIGEQSVHPQLLLRSKILTPTSDSVGVVFPIPKSLLGRME